jgi:hypothetical protein
LTFGWNPDVGTGNQIADRVNELLDEAEPDMFEDAAFESFANVGPQGSAEIRMYFFRGCNALDDSD